MKIKKIKKNNYNLINYNLIKFRLYLSLHKNFLYYLNSKYIKGFRNEFCIFELLKTKNFIKKSLLIIYKFHFLNKKILFVGFPDTKNKKYFKLFYQTKHFFIPQNIWTNNILFSNNLKKDTNIYMLKTVPDLIVLYNQRKETKAFQDIQRLKIPFITFIESSDKSDQLNYKIPGGFSNIIAENLVYTLLKSILTLPKLKYNDEKTNI